MLLRHLQRAWLQSKGLHRITPDVDDACSQAIFHDLLSEAEWKDQFGRDGVKGSLYDVLCLPLPDIVKEETDDRPNRSELDGAEHAMAEFEETYLQKVALFREFLSQYIQLDQQYSPLDVWKEEPELNHDVIEKEEAHFAKLLATRVRLDKSRADALFAHGIQLLDADIDFTNDRMRRAHTSPEREHWAQVHARLRAVLDELRKMDAKVRDQLQTTMTVKSAEYHMAIKAYKEKTRRFDEEYTYKVQHRRAEADVLFSQLVTHFRGGRSPVVAPPASPPPSSPSPPPLPSPLPVPQPASPLVMAFTPPPAAPLYQEYVPTKDELVKQIVDKWVTPKMKNSAGFIDRVKAAADRHEGSAGGDWVKPIVNAKSLKDAMILIKSQ